MVLGKREFAIVSFDRHIEREIFFKPMFEFDFEAKKFEIELSRLRLVKMRKMGVTCPMAMARKSLFSQGSRSITQANCLDAAVSLLRAFGRSQEFSNTERGGDNCRRPRSGQNARGLEGFTGRRVVVPDFNSSMKRSDRCVSCSNGA
ncbi:MAG: hypothetical protein Ct9H300mP8_10000 [Gammaproteobacteria bacterium]|nr:MAG: hypothetical protein Ct9H300mP8_10000 [Gammaproteobacteria bacterium]